MSHVATSRLVETLGDDHDAPVKMWRDKCIESLKDAHSQVCRVSIICLCDCIFQSNENQAAHLMVPRSAFSEESSSCYSSEYSVGSSFGIDDIQLISPLSCNESLNLSFGSDELYGVEDHDTTGLMPCWAEDNVQGENSAST